MKKQDVSCPKVIIYDWDGTRADSMSATYAALRSTFQAFDKAVPSFAEFVECLRNPPTVFYYERGFSRKISKKEIWSTFLGHANYSSIKLYPDVKKEIEKQKRSGWSLVLVSACPRDILLGLLAKHDLMTTFEHVLVTGSDQRKSTVFNRACRLLRIKRGDRHEIICVGDMACDMFEAVVAGLTPIGLCRDHPEISHILKSHGARLVFGSLKEFNSHLGIQ